MKTDEPKSTNIVKIAELLRKRLKRRFSAPMQVIIVTGLPPWEQMRMIVSWQMTEDGTPTTHDVLDTVLKMRRKYQAKAPEGYQISLCPCKVIEGQWRGMGLHHITI